MPDALVTTRQGREDLSWLPASLRRRLVATRVVAGTTIFGAGIGVNVLAHLLHQPLLAGAVLVGAIAAGGSLVRAVNHLISRRMRARLASGAETLDELRALVDTTDGELVRVRGVARAIEHRTLDGSPGWLVLRTLTRGRRGLLRLGPVRDLLVRDGSTIDRAVDFVLEPRRGEGDASRRGEGDASRRGEGDASRRGEGGHVHVSIAGSRLLADEPTLTRDVTYGVRDGDLVEIVGCKDRRVDPSVTSRLPRDTPIGMALRSGRQLPLLVIPVGAPSLLHDEGAR